jgi:hypothetical protein
MGGLRHGHDRVLVSPRIRFRKDGMTAVFRRGIRRLGRVQGRIITRGRNINQSQLHHQGHNHRKRKTNRLHPRRHPNTMKRSLNSLRNRPLSTKTTRPLGNQSLKNRPPTNNLSPPAKPRPRLRLHNRPQPRPRQPPTPSESTTSSKKNASHPPPKNPLQSTSSPPHPHPRPKNPAQQACVQSQGSTPPTQSSARPPRGNARSEMFL